MHEGAKDAVVAWVKRYPIGACLLWFTIVRQAFAFVEDGAGFIPIAYVVWRKRNIGIGIATHIALNMTMVLSMVNVLLRGR